MEVGEDTARLLADVCIISSFSTSAFLGAHVILASRESPKSFMVPLVWADAEVGRDPWAEALISDSLLGQQSPALVRPL